MSGLGRIFEFKIFWNTLLLTIFTAARTMTKARYLIPYMVHNIPSIIIIGLKAQCCRESLDNWILNLIKFCLPNFNRFQTSYSWSGLTFSQQFLSKKDCLLHYFFRLVLLIKFLVVPLLSLASWLLVHSVLVWILILGCKCRPITFGRRAAAIFLIFCRQRSKKPPFIPTPELKTVVPG